MALTIHRLHLRFHYCSVTPSSTLSRSILSRQPHLAPHLVVVIVVVYSFSLFSLSPSPSPAHARSSSSISSAARRRPDERDNSSSIRLSAASLFGPLPITLFLLLSALREDFDALSAKGERALIAASIRSDALERRVNSSQRSLIRTPGDAIERIHTLLLPFSFFSFFSFPGAFYILRPSSGFRFATLLIVAKKSSRAFAKYSGFQSRNIIKRR